MLEVGPLVALAWTAPRRHDVAGGDRTRSPAAPRARSIGFRSAAAFPGDGRSRRDRARPRERRPRRRPAIDPAAVAATPDPPRRLAPTRSGPASARGCLARAQERSTARSASGLASVRARAREVAADEVRRVRALLRTELLRTSDVHVGRVEVALAVGVELCTPQNPPGNAPNVPHEYSSLPVRSNFVNFWVMPSATHRCWSSDSRNEYGRRTFGQTSRNLPFSSKTWTREFARSLT